MPHPLRPSTPEQVVGRQLDAYNARDINTFMACWAKDAMMLAWPDTVLADGSDAIRARHIERFREKPLMAELISRASVGNLVIDVEIVHRDFGQGPAYAQVIGIYEIENGLIQRAFFQTRGADTHASRMRVRLKLSPIPFAQTLKLFKPSHRKTKTMRTTCPKTSRKTRSKQPGRRMWRF